MSGMQVVYKIDNFKCHVSYLDRVETWYKSIKIKLNRTYLIKKSNSSILNRKFCFKFMHRIKTIE